MEVSSVERVVLSSIAELYFTHCRYLTGAELVEEMSEMPALHGVFRRLRHLKRLDYCESCYPEVELRLTLPGELHGWIDDFRNVTRLGRFLAHEQVYTGEQVQSYYEKPWNYSDEFAGMLAIQAKEPTK